MLTDWIGLSGRRGKGNKTDSQTFGLSNLKKGAVFYGEGEEC